MKTVIVTGSRLHKQSKETILAYRNRVFRALDQEDPERVVHGGAAGVDSFAHTWCKDRGRISIVYFPDYERIGKGAPLVRNIRMVEDFPGSIVLGFPIVESKGTFHMMKVAKEAGSVVRNLGIDGSL